MIAAGADLATIDLPSLLPTVHLHVHLYGGTMAAGDTGPEFDRDPDTSRRRDQIARIEGHGSVTLTWLRTVLGTTCRFKITPVHDLEGQAPVDAYEIPDRHREAVHLMTPADVFPPRLEPRTSHHRLKTHGHGQVQQPFPGIYLWRDPAGRLHLVDHTGTRPLPGTPRQPITIHLYRSSVELDFSPAV